MPMNILHTKAIPMKNLNLDICDFHAHILPKADHGSYSIETSLRQMELAVKYGIRRIVATPHFYPHAMNVQDYIKKRDASFSTLQPMLPENISIRLGAEVLLCDNLENLPNLEMLCIGHSNRFMREPTINS